LPIEINIDHVHGTTATGYPVIRWNFIANAKGARTITRKNSNDPVVKIRVARYDYHGFIIQARMDIEARLAIPRVGRQSVRRVEPINDVLRALGNTVCRRHHQTRNDKQRSTVQISHGGYLR
jgi:hypothetical protein